MTAPFDLSGKTALVTGANTGIGQAIAVALSKAGADVAVAGRSAPTETLALIEANGRKAVNITADLSSIEPVARVVDETVAAFGRLDGLINNAGGMVRRVSYENATEKDYDDIMDLNGRSVVVATAAAIPHLKAAAKDDSGFIINTTSIAARNGASGGAGLYGSSKAFVHDMTRGLAKELIPFGIRVNAVAPGVITTPFHERYSTQAQLTAALATVPQGRLGVAQDCAGAYLFLASRALSAYIIGQVIEVNGGQLMP